MDHFGGPIQYFSDRSLDMLYKYNNINILLHLQRSDIVHRCNPDDLTALSHTTAASSDPSEPLLPDATLGPQGRHEGGSSPVPGRESGLIHLALVSKKGGRYQILYLL